MVVFLQSHKKKLHPRKSSPHFTEEMLYVFALRNIASPFPTCSYTKTNTAHTEHASQLNQLSSYTTNLKHLVTLKLKKPL